MVPQIIYLVLVAGALLFAAHDHGKPKKGFNSFWVTLISVGIQFGIMFWGGFFKPIFG